ncbi:MAG: HutD family protein [Paracoccaceae bacterium]
MRLILPAEFTAMPWQNGGGVTHEIARADEAGRLVWRLSIAEVASDGPFSAFPGLSRVLTVIDGAGLILAMPSGELTALPLAPVRFPGDVPVDCRRIAGPVRDFNLIFDAARVAGDVTALTGPARRNGPVAALLALTPGVFVSDGESDSALPPGAVALDAARVGLSSTARALIVTLGPL